ncbi:MAG: hypothetical protein IKZ61_05775 [Prevotella sp.]|nr:hypothetical protein [Prevotella sp.]
MTYYPDCPKCGNSNSALSVVDVEIDGYYLKGIKCNNPECGCYISFFKDYDKELESLKEMIDGLSSSIDDLK